MIEEKKQIDEGSKVVENNSENEDIDSSEESEVVEKEKSVEIMKE